MVAEVSGGVVVRRYELSDAEWAVIEPLIPEAAPTGRPQRAAREVFNAVFWILRSGSPWRDLPERYGPWQSIYHRFNSWRREGVFDRVLETLQVRLDAEGHIDWDLWCVDGSSIRASKAAAGAGKKGGPKSLETTRWVARAADSGARSTWLLTVTERRSRRKSRPAKRTSRSRSKGS
jgi:transposase